LAPGIIIHGHSQTRVREPVDHATGVRRASHPKGHHQTLARTRPCWPAWRRPSKTKAEGSLEATGAFPRPARWPRVRTRNEGRLTIGPQLNKLPHKVRLPPLPALC